MDEIRPMGGTLPPEWSIEEMEARLEGSGAPVGDPLAPESCVWACECFITYGE